MFVDKTVKRFYDLANDYYKSAKLLWGQIIDTPYIYNPTIYLLRHAAELSLKGLTINEEKKKNPTIHIDKIVMHNNSSKKITATHSLYDLWVNYKYLHKENHFILCYNHHQEQYINNILKFFNDKDFDSTRFRYPYNKHGKQFVIDPLSFDVAQFAPDLGTTPTNIIQYQNNIYAIKKGIRCIIQAQDLFEVVNLLFGFYV